MENTHDKKEAVEWVITSSGAIKFIGTNEEVQEYLRKEYAICESDEPKQIGENEYHIYAYIGDYERSATAKRWQDIECQKLKK